MTMADPQRLLLHSRTIAGSGTLISVNPGQAGWLYTSLLVQRLAAGATWQHETGADEAALVPLGGRCR
ncbi:MAG: hypothetical protein C4346_08935, partial [Chloroflexota bacterium]